MTKHTGPATDTQAFFFGFSRWKHTFVRPFFDGYGPENIIFINPQFSSHFDSALRKGMDETSHIYFWGRKSFPEVEEYSRQNDIKIFRVEDGFIRSIGLGSDLTQPYSQVIDRTGIYFDPTKPSDLENILNRYDFLKNPELIRRASALKEQLIANKISKYNAHGDNLAAFPAKEKTVALVAGQVEDDASIQYGADGMSNLQLLKEVRENYPDRYIVFKPHPDVLSGNRIGNIPTQEALRYCNEIVTDIGMAAALQAVDEVHTMTSLAGLEGLIYGKKVYTYGLPFYAGWGLTTDSRRCERRTAKRTLDELIAATYLLYPHYISPATRQPCEAEEVIAQLRQQKIALEKSWWLRTMFALRNWSSRVLQKLLAFASRPFSR